MPTSQAEGAQVATVTTEHTLTTITSAGDYVLTVDTSVMVLADKLELRAKVKVRSTGTTRQAYIATYAHVQEDPVKLSIPISVISEVVFTLKQTAGTSRTFQWEVVKL